MTVRERMLHVYNNEIPDQIPVGIYNRYLPRGTWEREVRNTGLGIIAYYPISTLMAPPWHLTPGFFSEIKNVDFQLSYKWTNGERIEVRTFETPVGTISEHITKDPVYGSDWISKHYITCEEDYKILSYIAENTVFSSNEKHIRDLRKDLGDDGVVLGRIDRTPFQKMIVELAGPERFLIDMMSEVPAVGELLEIMGQRHIESMDMILNSSADVIWQPENVTGELTPPYYYEEYCMPYYIAVSERCTAAGKPYVVHLDGRLKALSEKIDQSAFGGIESFSYMQMGNDISLSDLRKACPDKVILPNFPSGLSTESEEVITQFLNEAFKEAGTDKAFMIQISEDIPKDQLYKVASLLCRYTEKKG